MSELDIKAFNQFQNQVQVIDTNLNGVLDPQDVVIAIHLEGFRRGEKVPWDHPRLKELFQNYEACQRSELGPSHRL